MKRREFLRTAFYMSAASVLSACGSAPVDETVIVVGAGMAGLAAARTLQEAGYQVVVLEGRDRWGGRVWTSHQWADAPLDLGASWIHGTTNNPLTTLADEVAAQRLVTDYDNLLLYDVDGRPATEAQRSRLEGYAVDLLAVAARANLNIFSDDYALQEAIAEAVDWGNLSAVERREINFFLNMLLEQDLAADTAELSAQSFDDADAYGGEDVLFAKGYETIVNHLAQGVDIRLNQRVQQLDYGAAGVTVTTARETFTADRAVVTLPLGVLKKGGVRFAPALPAEKIAAIETLGMGVLNKTYLRFPQPFWPSAPEWLTYISAEKGHWAAWLNIYHYTDLPILAGFNAAAFGRDLEAWSDEVIVADAMGVLRTIFGLDIPEPVDWQITRWASDSFAYGSYSFNGVGASRQTRETLAQPIAERLFFAGEATSADHPSTVHGAYLSGLRAAREVMG